MRTVISHRMRLTLRNQYNYTPVSNFKIQNKINPIISVTLGTPKETLCQIHFRLFENVVPRTAQNFKRLLLGTGKYEGRSLSLLGNYFNRVVPRAYLEIGHLQDGNCSIFGPKFRDQSFQLLHDRPGLLTSISEENSNNSRFGITLAPCPFLDFRNVVFGEITADTFDNLRKLQKLGDRITGYQIKESRQVEEQGHHEEHAHH